MTQMKIRIVVLFSTDIIYGSGLRNGFANTTPPARINWLDDAKPATLRFDIVNVFDHV
jgi:hypothetical protein